MSDAPKNNAPVRTFQSGLLNVAIFAHTSRDGRVFHTVTPQRSYRVEGQQDWNRINSYNRDDLPVMSALFERAWQWVINEEEKQRAKLAAARDTAPASE